MSNHTQWIWALVLFLWPSICAAAEVPRGLAGFALGDKISAHMDKITSDTVLPVRYLESLKEVETKNIRGYKTGLVSYTTCTRPSRIVRIKFKYADASKAFYNALLKRFKDRFGEPDEYRGDPQHLASVEAWRRCPAWLYTVFERVFHAAFFSSTGSPFSAFRLVLLY